MDATSHDNEQKPWSLARALNLGSAALGLCDQGIVSLVNFLTVVLLARSLTLVDFGLFMTAHTVLLLLTGLQNALVAQPHNILGAQRNGIDYARLTVVLGVLQFVASLLLALIAVAAGSVWTARGDIHYASVAFALAIALPAWMGQEYMRRILYTEGDIAGAALNNFVTYGLQLAGILMVITGAFGIDATPANAVIALGASSFVGCAWGWLQHRRRAQAKYTLASLHLRSVHEFANTVAETWRLSRWLVAQQSIAWLGASGHGLLLTALLGPATFGLYRAAYQVVNLLNPFRQAVTNHLPSIAARKFSSGGADELARWTRRMTVLLVVPFALCALLIAVSAPLLAKIMYGSQLQVSGVDMIVALGALAYTLNFARTPLDYAVLVAGGGRSLFLRTVWLNAFVLSGGILLIRQLGIVGALISEVAIAILAAVLTLKVAASLLKSSATATPIPDVGPSQPIQGLSS